MSCRDIFYEIKRMTAQLVYTGSPANIFKGKNNE